MVIYVNNLRGKLWFPSSPGAQRSFTTYYVYVTLRLIYTASEENGYDFIIIDTKTEKTQRKISSVWQFGTE